MILLVLIVIATHKPTMEMCQWIWLFFVQAKVLCHHFNAKRRYNRVNIKGFFFITRTFYTLYSIFHFHYWRSYITRNPPKRIEIAIWLYYATVVSALGRGFCKVKLPVNCLERKVECDAFVQWWYRWRWSIWTLVT